MNGPGLYVHIPFCAHKCIYCDFYSVISEKNKSSFLEALKKEIEYYSFYFSRGREFSSIFFGGGTPSLLAPDEISSVITTLKSNFSVSSQAEITLETNPGTVDYEKLRMFKNSGINRLSIGVQTFDEGELKFLTRIHDSAGAIETVRLASRAGFGNINIDLIFNLPGQTKEIFLKNLKIACSLPVTHISAYSLILERGTALYKLVKDGKAVLNADDYDADLYETCIDYLSSRGFTQYEVSNFSKPGFQCRHNKTYWEYRDYLSFGPSAHSFAGGRRWWNFRALGRYINSVEKTGLVKKETGAYPGLAKSAAGSEILTKEEQLAEYVMLALRSGGLKTGEFEKYFGPFWLREKSPLFTQMEFEGYCTESEGIIKLTKKGYLFCDSLLEKIL